MYQDQTVCIWIAQILYLYMTALILLLLFFLNYWKECISRYQSKLYLILSNIHFMVMYSIYIHYDRRKNGELNSHQTKYKMIKRDRKKVKHCAFVTNNPLHAEHNEQWDIQRPEGIQMACIGNKITVNHFNTLSVRRCTHIHSFSSCTIFTIAKTLQSTQTTTIINHQ